MGWNGTETPWFGTEQESRLEPFPIRVYQQYLKRYKPASDLREEDKAAVETELTTELQDGYLGQVCMA